MKEDNFEYHELHSEFTEEITNFLKAPQAEQRLKWYTDKLAFNKRAPIKRVFYFEAEERIVYSEVSYTIKMGKKAYPSQVGKRGFTFDKKSEKIKFWYLSSINHMEHLALLLRKLNKEWVVDEGFIKNKMVPSRLHLQQPSRLNWITKTVLEKVLAGKITNPTQAVKQIIKVNHIKGASPKLLKKFIKENEKIDLLIVKDCLTDINCFLSDRKPFESDLMRDVIKQAKALDRKINPKWSKKRLNQLHIEWSREIMKEELKYLEEEVVEFEYPIPLPPNVEHIVNRKRLFEEGNMMDHCAYTNYWERVKNKSYLIFHVEIEEDGGKFTVGGRPLFENSKCVDIRIDQICGIHNATPPTNVRNYIMELFNTPSIAGAIRKNYRIPTIITDEDVEDLPF